MPIREHPRIFISYARSDGKEYARRLRRRLMDEHSFAIWQDLADMEAGKDWWQQTEAIIRHADLEYLVLVVTENALQSTVVHDEWRLARQEGKCVVPVIGATAVRAHIASLPGWMKAVNFVDPDEPEQWQRFIRTLQSPCEQRRVPMMAPRLPTDFVARPGEFEALKHLLVSEPQGPRVSITAALKGAGGYGKTTLASALCHDNAVQQRFHQGILWVTLGETPDLIKQVLDLIEVLTGTRPGYEDFGAASARLGELLGSRACLLVIDDVWKRSHLEPFLSGGAHCGWLITTRNSDTLPQESERVQVDAMKNAEAVRLLRVGLPAGETQRFEGLAKRLGEWPLLLKLANGVLAQRVAAKQPLSAALDYVDKALDRRGLAAFDAADEADRNGAVEKSLGLSLELLTAEQRERFAELAIFPEDTDVPLSMVERLWKATAALDEIDAEELCHRLFRLSLLLDFNLAARTLRLHDVIRALLERDNRARAAIWHGQFLDAAGVANWAKLPRNEHYLWRTLAYHLKWAGREAALRGLLFEFDWLRAKLAATGINGLLGDFDFVPADDAVLQLRHGLRTAAHILGREPGQLAAQLFGRLTTESAEISELLGKARAEQAGVWLCPVRPTLASDPALVRTLEGHTHSVDAVAITPDGKRAVSGSGDWTLKVWELGSGNLLRTLEGHADSVNAVAITPDGKRAVSGSSDETLRLWELDGAASVRTLAGHRYSVHAVAITPDGKCAVSGSEDQTLKVWELDTGALLHTLEGHADSVNAVAITPDGKCAVSGSRDRTLKVWDLDRGALLRTLPGHADSVETVAITPDGKCAVSGSRDQTLKVWDLDRGALLRTLVGHAGWVSDVAITPGGERALSGSDDSTLKVWDLGSGALLRTLDEHTDPVGAVAIAPDGKRAVSGSRDFTLKVWELDGDAPLLRLEGHAHSVAATAITPDGKRAVSGSQDHILKVWDLDSGALLHTLGDASWGLAVAITPDGKHAVSALRDNTLSVWEIDSGALLRTLEGQVTSWVLAVAITPDGKRAVSGAGDRTLDVWELDSGAWVRTLEGHTDPVYAVAITSDGTCVVSGSSDRTLKVWQLDTGALLRTLEGHAGSVAAVAITPDGKQAVSGSSDHTLKVWELDSGALLRTLEGHAGRVNAVAITPDGKRALSGSEDHTLKVWELALGKQVTSWSADAGIRTCAITRDGRRIVAGDQSGRLHFLEILGLPE